MKIRDLINMSLKQLGIGAMGTTASDEDLADALLNLNMMLGNWQRKRWFIPCLEDVAFSSGVGKSIYYVGPGGDLDLPNRPDHVLACYARMLSSSTNIARNGEFVGDQFDNSEFNVKTDGNDGSGNIDYSLTLIPTLEEYSRIGLKGLKSFPSYYNYNAGYPLGELRIYPIPTNQNWEIHCIIKSFLKYDYALDDDIKLPPEYADAIMYTLAVRIAPMYGQEASPTVMNLARAGTNVIRMANHVTPLLETPAGFNSYRPGNGMIPASVLKGWI